MLWKHIEYSCGWQESNTVKRKPPIWDTGRGKHATTMQGSCHWSTLQLVFCWLGNICGVVAHQIQDWRKKKSERRSLTRAQTHFENGGQATIYLYSWSTSRAILSASSGYLRVSARFFRHRYKMSIGVYYGNRLITLHKCYPASNIKMH